MQSPISSSDPQAKDQPAPEGELYFRQFAMGSDDVFWLADIDSGKLLFINAAVERLFGVSPAEIQRDPSLWNMAVVAEDREVLSQPFFVAESRALPVRDYRVKRPSGELRWIHDRRFLLTDEQGSVVRVGGIAEDVTDRRQAEIASANALAREREARAQAEALALSKDEFLSVISHELRSPLNAIRGWTYVLRQTGGLSTVQERALAAIDRNTQAQARIVDDLLDSQRILLGTFTLELHKAHLSEIVEEAVEAVRHSALGKRIAISISHDDSIGMVTVDVRRIGQALSHLVSNAVKFTPDGGSVSISTRRGPGATEIVVADTGIGIEAPHLPHLFDRFHQADASRTRRQGGLGLGLSLSRQLVELHGGRITAESAGHGLGSTFIIRLPDATVSAPADNQPTVDDHPDTQDDFPLEGRRIMVVEDDVDSREMLELILRETHADLVSFDSAGPAYEYLASLPPDQRPDALVSDIAMPDEDGYSFIRRVRSLTQPPSGTPRMVALALTAFARDEDRARSMKAGFDVHMGKPIDSAILVETLRTALVRTPMTAASMA